MSFDFFCGETEEPPGRFLKTVANGFDIGLVDEPSHEESPVLLLRKTLANGFITAGTP